jgi:hypothetical protein
MEPLTIVAISATVGGTAGKLVEKAWDSGEKWLAHYFRDHHPKAIEKAKQNSLDFLNVLSKRVDELEEDSKDHERIKRQIDSALEDPDFSALLKDALIASSRTDNEDKHKILARIVSERLRVPTDNLVALTSTLACDAVKHLTTRQLTFLGLTALVHFIRPKSLPPAVSTQQASQLYVDRLTQNLQLYFPLEPLKPIDFRHLESVSCIIYDTVYGFDLREVLIPYALEWPFEEFIEKDQFGKQLYYLWENGMQFTVVTTTGWLIGIYAHDELAGTTTDPLSSLAERIERIPPIYGYSI